MSQHTNESIDTQDERDRVSAVRPNEDLPSVLEMSQDASSKPDLLPVIVVCLALLLLIGLIVLFLGSLDTDALLGPFEKAMQTLEQIRDAFKKLHNPLD